MTNNKGQSTVEYILLFTAVVTVLILFLNVEESPLKRQLNNTYVDVTDQMGVLTRRLTGTTAPPYIPDEPAPTGEVTEGTTTASGPVTPAPTPTQIR